MNKIYRVIWSCILKQFVVVNELTKARGKASRAHIGKRRQSLPILTVTRSKVAAALLAALGGMALSAAAAENDGWLDLRSADLPTVVRNDAPVELHQEEGGAVSFTFEDLHLDEVSRIEGNHAFDPYLWNEHQTDSGEVRPAIDQTVKVIGSETSRVDEEARGWVSLKDQDWSAVAKGNPGSNGSLSAGDVLESGGTVTITNISDGEETTTGPIYSEDAFQAALQNEFTLGGTEAVVFKDEVTGTDRTANVWRPYDADSNPDGFREMAYEADEAFPRPQKSDFYDDNGNRLGAGQYVDKVFFSVKGDAGLRVQVGSNEAPSEFNAILKVSDGNAYSTVFEAVDGGEISYESKTNVALAADSDVAGGNHSIGWTHEYISYTNLAVADLDTLTYVKKDQEGNEETVTVRRNDAEKIAELTAGGFELDESRTVAFTVKDYDSLVAYNEYLIGMLGKKNESGSYDEAWYQAAFQKGFVIGTQSWTADFPPTADFYVPADDSSAKGANQQQVSFIRAGKSEGAEADADYGRVVVRENAEIRMASSLASILRVDGEGQADSPIQDIQDADAVIEKGATLQVSGAYGWAVNAHGGAVWNAGTIAVGEQTQAGEGLRVQDGYGLVGVHLEQGARFENQAGGLVQYGAGSFGKAVEVESGSVFSNAGLLNMATGAFRAPTKDDNYGVRQNFERSSLVTVSSENSNAPSRFVNEAGGVIYLGGSNVEQADLPTEWSKENVLDYMSKTTSAESHEQPLDVFAIGSGGEFVNEGVISTGTGLRNMNIVRLEESGAKFVNKGAITLNTVKTSDGDQSFNSVVQALAGTEAVNEGTIVLNGVNAVALQALDAEENDTNPRVVNKGTITVGAAGEGSAPNYAIWAEGAGTLAQNAGTINLEGDRAIGIHARNGADILVTENAAINFDSSNTGAEGQIAYLIYGQGEGGEATSITDSSTSSHAVTADRSTYFRVDTGASLDLRNGSYSVSGEGSSIITVTGEGANFTASNSDAEKLNLSVTGKDSAALLVTGGGYAFWGGNVDIDVTGEDSAIAIISGEYIDVETNEPYPSKFAETYFDNKATVTGDDVSSEAVAFRVQTGGVLRNQGQIVFEDQAQESTQTFTGVLLEGGKLLNGWDEHGEPLENADDVKISVDGIAVEIRGADGEETLQSELQNRGTIEATDGTAALYLTQKASLLLTGSDEGTITAGGAAHAILADQSAGVLTLDGASLVMKEGGSGNAVENRSENALNVNAANIQIENGIGIHSEKINFGASDKTTTIRVNGENGVGIQQEKINAEGIGSATTEDLKFNNSVTVVGATLENDDTDYRGTGIAANTTGAVTVDGTLKGLKTGVEVLGNAQSVTVGENARIEVGSDGEEAGAGIDLSSSGDVVKTVGAVEVVQKSSIDAVGTADGLDFSGSRIAGPIEVAGEVSVQNGAAVNLSQTNSESTDPIKVTISGTLSVADNGSGAGILVDSIQHELQIVNSGTISASQTGDGIRGSGVAASVNIVNSGKIEGGIQLENDDGRQVRHKVDLESGSELAGGIALSTGDDIVTVAGSADRIDTQAGNDRVEIQSSGTAGVVVLGEGDDELRLTKLVADLTADAEADVNQPFSSASGGEGFDVFALDESTVSVDGQGADHIKGFERIELTKSKLTLEGEDALFLKNYLNNNPTDGYKAQVAFQDADSILTLKFGETDTIFDYGWTMEGAGTLRVEGNADNSQETFAFDFESESDAGVLADWTGENFTGKFELANANADLDALTARALRSSTAYIEKGAVLTVGRVDNEGDDNVFSYLSGLVFDGGTVAWDEESNIQASSSAERGEIIFTDSQRKIKIADNGVLDFSEGGIVSVQIDTDVDSSLETDNNVTRFTLMEQDEGSVDVQLIQAGQNVEFLGDVSNLTLVMKDGDRVLEPQDLAVDLYNEAGLTKTAVAYYNYGLSTSSLGQGHGHGYGSDSGEETGEQNGLYLAKRLERIHLIGTGEESSPLMTLRGNEQSVFGDELHALLYGEGGFQFTGFNPEPVGGSRAVGYITNGDNVYSGKTLVGGNTTLVVAVSGALGGTDNQFTDPADDRKYEGLYTKEVAVEANATLRLGVYGLTDADYGAASVKQTIGSLSVDYGGDVDLGASTLTIAGAIDGSEQKSWINGHLIGKTTSRLELEKGSLRVDDANGGYYGTSVIKAGAVASIGDGLSLGTGTIELEGDGSDASMLQIATMTDPNFFQLGAIVKSTGEGDTNRNSLIVFGEPYAQPYTSEFQFAEGENDFQGTLALTNAIYDFGAEGSGNAEALEDATLELRKGVSVKTSGQNHLASIVFGDAAINNQNPINKVDFSYLSLGRAVNDHAFILGGTGSDENAVQIGDGTTIFTVAATQEGVVSGGQSLQEAADGTVAEGALSLLDQDDGNMFTALIKHEGNAKSKVEQTAIDEHLELVGLDGEDNEVALKSAVVELMKAGTNGETKIADGYYELVAQGDSLLTINEIGDIGVTSKLTRIDIVDGQTVTFDDVEGETKDNKFSALITEQGKGGSIAIAPVEIGESDSKETEVILSNSQNRFTGSTTILDRAHLTLGENDVLGSRNENDLKQTGFTSSVILVGKSSILDLNGKSQTIGFVSPTVNISIESSIDQSLRNIGGIIDFGESGNLSIAGLSDSAVGEICGSGKLTLEKSDLYINHDADSKTSVEFKIGTDGTGRLIAGSDDALGSGSVSLAGDDDQLVLALTGTNNIFDNTVSGSGSMEFWSGTNVTVLGDGEGNSFTGGVIVRTGADVDMGNAEKDGRKFAGSGNFTIDKGGKLTMNVSSDWQLAKTKQLVQGAGTLAVIQNGEKRQESFVFAEGQNKNEDTSFTGRLDLTNIRIGFSETENTGEGRNKDILQDVTLVLNNESVGDFNAENIQFDGFETVGEKVLLDYTEYENQWTAYGNATNVIYADSFKFDRTSTGVVAVDLGNVENSIKNAETEVDGIGERPLLDQDNGNVIYYLGLLTEGTSGKVEGSLAGFDLKLLNENELVSPANPYRAVIEQDDKEVATGYYNLGLSTDDKGFGVNFGLQEIWVYGGNTLKLASGDDDNTLSARLTEHPNAQSEVTEDHPEGIGSIEVIGGETVRLSNPENDITGKATIGAEATLIVAASGALGGGLSEDDGSETQYGYVSNVTTESGTLQIGEDSSNGVEQAIGTIHVEEAGAIVLKEDSKLTITGGFVAEERDLADNKILGRISGDDSAQLIVAGGSELTVSTDNNVANNDESSFRTIVTGGSKLTLGNSLSLGTGVIELADGSEGSEDTLVIEANNSDWTMENALAGAGLVQFTGNDQALYLKEDENKKFKGTLSITNGIFGMQGDAAEGSETNEREQTNACVMANASLEMTAGSHLALSGGRTTLANLTLSGSTLAAGAIVSDDSGSYYSSGWIDMTREDNSSGILTIEGQNTLQLSGLGNINDFSLLLQDDGVVATIIKANSVDKDENSSVHLSLPENDQPDPYKNLVSQSLQNGAATGWYGVDNNEAFFENENQAGLFVKAQLLEANVAEGKTLHLTPEDGVEEAQPGSTFSAAITGKGNISVSGNVTLKPAEEGSFITSFTGTTLVSQESTLRLASSGSLGTRDSHTSVVYLSNGAKLSVLEGTNQYAGGLDTAEKAVVELGEESVLYLTGTDKAGLSSDIRYANTLQGTGDLVIKGGTHRIESANDNYGGTDQAGDATMVKVGEAGTETAATLEIGHASALGSADVSLAEKGTLAFVRLDEDGFNDAFTNKLAGNGTVVALEGVTAEIDENAGEAFEGLYQVNEGALLTLTGAEEFGSADGFVADGGTLSLRITLGDSDKSWTMTQNTVRGQGVFAVDLGRSSQGVSIDAVNNQLNFGKTVAKEMAEGFDGTLSLTNARLRIQDVASTDQAPDGNYAETALAKAVLEIGKGARVMVGDNDFAYGKTYHEIGGLSFAADADSDGTLRLGETTAINLGEMSDPQSPLLSVTKLDATGSGFIEINVTDDAFAGTGNSAAGTQNKYHSLLEQDDGDLFVQLIRATGGKDDIEGHGGSIGIKFVQNGEILNADTQPAIEDTLAKISQYDREGDDAPTVAVGHYGYRASIYDDDGKTSGNDSNNGLWLAYGLKQTDIQNGQTLVLTPGTAGRNGSSDFSAKITEIQYDLDTMQVKDVAAEDSVGNVEIRGDVSISNQENAFHGRTTVTEGSTLLAAADNVLGQAKDLQHTSELVLEASAGFDLNGHEQTIGMLNAQTNAWVDLDGDEAAEDGRAASGAQLVIENGGATASANALRGTGTIVLELGVLSVAGANAALAGDFVIGQAAAANASLLAESDDNVESPSDSTGTAAVTIINDADGLGQSSIHFENKDSLLYFKNVGGNVAFDNQLLGNGTVRADGSAVLVDADNSAFTGTWEIGTGNAYDMAGQKLETAAGASTLRFVQLSALGGTAENGYADFAIGAGSTLELGIQSSYELMHETTGEGGVTIDAGADENGSLNVVTLNSTFAHTGLTHVVSGGIRSAGDETASDVSDAEDGSAPSDVTADNVEAASAQAEDGAEESAGNAESSAARRTTIQGDLTLDAGTFMEGFAGVKGTVTNAGTIYVNWKRYADEALGESPSTVYDEATANTLHIAGDYVGQDGTLVFNGALAGDDSPVDTIEIAGNASGTGKVQVHNLGGKGDLTSPYGITLVTVEGDSTLSLSQDGRIVAGAYDYVLLRDPDSRRFYLQSTAGEYPISPEAPIGPLVRPEAGAYMSAAMASNLAEMRLHDRAGESHYVDPLSGEVKETSMWLRQTASHTHFRSAGETLLTHMTGGVTQIGGDIIRRSGDGDLRANLGLFGSALYAKSSTRSTLSSHSADTSTDGYSVGLYATLFNGQGKRLDSGGYLDLWAQYAWLNHEIRPKELATEELDADGIIASVEAGWTFHLGTTARGTSHAVDWSLQPQFQAIYEGVKLDDHVEAEGTRVKMTGEGNVKTRLGFRLQASPETALDERRGQGFLEFNWIHNTKTLGVEMDGVEVESEGMKHAGEVRFGLEGELSKNLHGWIAGGYLAGGSGYHEETVNIGLKYLW